MPKAYSYQRFSTPEQMKGDSLRRQTKLAEEYAARHKLTLDTELNMQDLGVSAFRGDNLETGALGAFLKAIKQGIVEPGSFLLVESLDRISRKSARKAVRILEEIVEAGVVVVTLNDGRQYTEESLDGFDFVMAVIILIRANEESSTKSKRIKAAWQSKRTRAALEGRPSNTARLTAHCPSWLRAAPSGGFEVIPGRVAVVQRIVQAVLAGQGKIGIAKALNREHVPCFDNTNGRTARRWHRSRIDRIVTSPALVGTFVPNVESYGKDNKLTLIPQEPIPNYYPAVIDQDTYDRLQTLARSSPLRGRHAYRELQNVLTGLATCGHCGSTVTRVAKGKQAVGYLVCAGAKAGTGCSYRSVKQETVEQALMRELPHILATMPSADAALESRYKAAQAAVDGTQETLQALVDLLARRPSEALAARVAELEGTLKSLQAELVTVEHQWRAGDSRALTLRAANLAEAVHSGDRRKLNAALREMFKAAVVHVERGYLELQWRHADATETVWFAMTPFRGHLNGPSA